MSPCGVSCYHFFRHETRRENYEALDLAKEHLRQPLGPRGELSLGDGASRCIFRFEIPRAGHGGWRFAFGLRFRAMEMGPSEGVPEGSDARYHNHFARPSGLLPGKEVGNSTFVSSIP